MNGDIIRLSFSARPDYILAVRLAVSAVAERVGFDIEDIEDLKVASAEACILLLEAGPGLIELCITVREGLVLEFAASGKATGADEKAPEGLSRYLLDALVDACAFDEADDGVVRAVRLEKKLSL